MSAAPAWHPDEPWSIFSLTELAEGDIDPYLQKVAESAAAHFHASGASIFLSDGDSGLYRVRARAGGQSTVPASAVIVRGQGVAGRVATKGTARILGDISNEPDLLDIAPVDHAAVSSSIVVPLQGPDENVVGVLNLSRHRSMRPFSEDDLERAKAVGAMVWLAVENARLVERARDQMREGERLRRLAEIGQMTAAVAHEIRNPLTGIRSSAQMIRENPEMAEEFLGMIEEEVLKLNALCEEFLAFARPMELVRQECELEALVERVCERSRPEFEADGVRLVVEKGSHSDALHLDERRVEQVVHNLLRNARQACAPSGLVRVRVEGSRLIVADDGPGISPAQMERLFSPFFTTKADGTGLGLCNVRRIVDAHGGKVVAESEQGKGSRFTVDFRSER
jgi:signal transduction histidine kinase